MAVRSLCVWLQPISLASPPTGTQSPGLSLATGTCWSILHICALPLCPVNCNPSFKTHPCVLYPPLRSHPTFPRQAGHFVLWTPLLFVSSWGTYHTYPVNWGMCASITAQYLKLLGGQGLVLRLNSAYPAPSPGHDTSRHSQVFVRCCSRSQSYK